MSDDLDAAAAELGRHYVAGNLEADAFSARLDALYAAPDEAARARVLAGLPSLESAAPAPVRSRTGWWRSRHGESDGPGMDWVPTPERFLDPTTNRVMRVWVEAGTRTRHYVAEAA